MKYKITLTIILFIFSFLYLKNAIYIMRENDVLMKIIKEKQDKYNIKPVNAIITKNTMIPGIKGKRINLQKSYSNMKRLNEFHESLLVFDKINPDKQINNIYDKVIIKGNFKLNQVSIITNLDNDYCYTENITIKKECVINHQYTILIHKITNNYLTKLKEKLANGKIFFLDSINQNEFDLITKYLKNNNYEIVPISKLIAE